MYVCICNAIRESDLRATASTADGCAITAYEKMGKMPNCGQCLQKAAQILDEEIAAAKSGASCKELAI
jgi:bacterioferritin-associated ferredoxin